MKGDEVKLDVRFCDGELKVSAASLFDVLSLEDKLELARRISVEDDVVVSVVDQLLSGWTEAGDSASNTVLDAQRRRLLDAIGDEVLKRVVIHALREVEAAKERVRDAKKKAVEDDFAVAKAAEALKKAKAALKKSAATVIAAEKAAKGDVKALVEAQQETERGIVGALKAGRVPSPLVVERRA